MASVVCKGCGRQLSNTEFVCPECNTALPVASDISPMEDCEKELKQVKLHWIVVVIMFWVTVAVITGLFLIHGNAYLNELVFLAAIFMALGVYLKTKVMRVQRKKPRV